MDGLDQYFPVKKQIMSIQLIVGKRVHVYCSMDIPKRSSREFVGLRLPEITTRSGQISSESDLWDCFSWVTEEQIYDLLTIFRKRDNTRHNRLFF